jgi:hypothetical protein
VAKEAPIDFELAHVRSALETSYDVVFYQKRPIPIPVPDHKYIAKIVGEESTAAVFSFNAIASYLKGSPVGDSFGTDHEARRTWRSEMIHEFGDSFNTLYTRSNQFRTNLMARGTSAMGALSMYAEEAGSFKVAERLIDIQDKIDMALDGFDPKSGKAIGPSYWDMTSDHEKLPVVYFVEERFLEALNIFTPRNRRVELPQY